MSWVNRGAVNNNGSTHKANVRHNTLKGTNSAARRFVSTQNRARKIQAITRSPIPKNTNTVEECSIRLRLTTQESFHPGLSTTGQAPAPQPPMAIMMEPTVPRIMEIRRRRR